MTNRQITLFSEILSLFIKTFEHELRTPFLKQNPIHGQLRELIRFISNQGVTVRKLTLDDVNAEIDGISLDFRTMNQLKLLKVKRTEKELAVKHKDFEHAARLRDAERKILEKMEKDVYDQLFPAKGFAMVQKGEILLHPDFPDYQ